MPFVDIIDRSHGVSEADEYGVRVIRNESTERHGRAVLAALESLRSGGILPEAKGYSLPPMVEGLDVAKMGKEAWHEMLNAATWTPLWNQDASINLDHPDVKAVL